MLTGKSQVAENKPPREKVNRFDNDIAEDIQVFRGTVNQYRQLDTEKDVRFFRCRAFIPKASVGKGFRINNRFYGNALSVQKCAIWVGENAELTIGDNVGISSSFVVAADRITIEDNVKIGGGCYIMDTDFHSSDPEARKNPGSDRQGTRTAPVTIRENAFIGASSIILKGTVIGRNSIIGAGSVVTGNVPDNQLWAGNPARFIKQL